jgi:hypothetical protein
MTVLLQRVGQTIRRVRFSELIPLALRCLALLLLGVARARPSVATLHTGGRGESIDAVWFIAM